jgi:hypothetical protein
VALGLATGAVAQTTCDTDSSGKPTCHADVGRGQESDGDHDAARARAKDRAVDAWEALKRAFGNSGPRYPNIFAESLPGPNGEVHPNFVWGQGQVVRAALNVAKLTGDYSDFARTAPTLSRYLLTNAGTTGFAPNVDPGQFSPPPPRWWDDNGVTGLVPLQAYAQTGAAQHLQGARNLWPFFKAGQWPAGGQRENEAPFGQLIALGATSSDDQNAEHLHLATSAADPQRADYLNFALANDAVVKTVLRAPGGLYWNGYYPDIQIGKFKWCDGTLLKNGTCLGTWWACNPNRSDLPPPQQLPGTPHVCAWMFDYEQGYMIGSDLLLYRITGDRNYLSSAVRTANAALPYYTLDWLWAQPAWFNAVYFVGLFQLDHYAPDPRIRAHLEEYLARAWREARDPDTGLFTRGGIGIQDKATGFGSLDQSAFVIMYSLLAWPHDQLLDVY